MTVEVAPGDLLRGNVPELAGLVIGQSRELDHAFAADDPEPSRAGKTAHFTFTLKGLKRQLVPALDDDFAKEVGGGETLAELKTKVRGDLEAAAKNRAAQDERDQLVKGLVERNPFDLPKAMIERGLDAMLDGALRMMARQGLDPSQAQPRLRLAPRGDAAQGGGGGARGAVAGRRWRRRKDSPSTPTRWTRALPSMRPRAERRSTRCARPSRSPTSGGRSSSGSGRKRRLNS